MRDGDFPLGRLRSQGAAPTCPRCDLADVITKTGAAQPALLPPPSPIRVQLSQAGLGSSARARVQLSQAGMGSRAWARRPCPELPPPASHTRQQSRDADHDPLLTQPLWHFLRPSLLLCRRKWVSKLCSLKKLGASAHFQSELNGNKSAFGKYQCGYYEKNLPTLHATHS